MSDNQYFASGLGVDTDRQRLALQEQVLDPTTIRHLESIGVAPGWRCLNVGAGSGSISVWLAERVGPAGRVVATDVKTDLHRRGNGSVEIRQHDILRDELEQGYYDLVCSRALLQHLPQPGLALSCMANAVKPGGWVLIEEIHNWSIRSLNEDTPSAALFNGFMHDFFVFAETVRMLDPGLASRVRPLVEGLGFQEVGNEALVHSVRGREPWARALHMTFRAGFDKVRDVTSPELTKLRPMFEEVAKLLEDPSFCFLGDPLFAAWGRKPGDAENGGSSHPNLGLLK